MRYFVGFLVACIMAVTAADAGMLMLGGGKRDGTPGGTIITPVITSPLTASATVDVPFSYQIAALNTPTSFNATSLPAGLTVSTVTGIISGTPTGAGTPSIGISATNSAGTDNKTLVVTVAASPPGNCDLLLQSGDQFLLQNGDTLDICSAVVAGAPVVTSPTSASGTVSVAFSYQITATNTPTSYGATGLPAGLSVNTGTGLIDGTPSGNGVSNVVISATNASGTGTGPLDITVSGAPTITSALTASDVVNTTFSYQITATNTPTSFNASGLPPGLAVNTSTGLIDGTSTQVGTFNVGLSATNATGTGIATLVVTINAAPVVTSSLTASGTVGSAFSYQITATNSPTSYSASGLPSGLSVNTGTGLISGTPTVTGTPSVTLGATNATGTGNATLALTITGAGAPAVTSNLNASGVLGAAFTYQITATNTPTSYSATGLPPGLSVNTASGIISGTPTSPAGTSNVPISATNATGTGSATLILRIDAPAAPIVSSSLTASSQVSASFSYQITASNNPTSFNATGLPSGLSVSTSTGLISGSPTSAATTNVTINASNVTGTCSEVLVLTVAAAPVAGLWTPAEEPNTMLWFRAKDSSTITFGTGSSVASWSDKQSNVLATQSISTRQPIYGATSFNGTGEPGLTFTHTTFQNLQTPSITAPQQWTVFALVKSGVTSASQAVLYGDSNTGAGTRKGIYSRILAAGTGSQPFAFSDTDVAFGATTQTIGLGAPVLLTTVRDGTTIKTSVNGGTLASVATTGVPASGPIAFGIGAATTQVSSFLNGVVSEIVFVNRALSLADIARFEGYLSWDHTLQANLPGGHIYKNAAPTTAVPTAGVIAAPVGEFLDTIGVNGHVSANLQDRLIYTGARTLRIDNISPTDMSTLVSIYNGTKVPGVRPGTKVNYITNARTANITDTLANRVSRIRTLAAGGALRSVEQVNEPNNQSVNWQGDLGGYGGNFRPVAKFTRDFYAAVKSDPVLAQYPVLGISEAGSQGAYPSTATTNNYGLQFLNVKGGRANQAELAANGLIDAEYSDFVNGHNYVSNGSAPVANSAWNASSPDVHVTGYDDLPANNGPTMWGQPGAYAGYPSAELATIPKVTTETGWPTSGPAYSTTVSIQGKLILNVFLAQFKRGKFAQTFIYELVDNQGSPGQGFGLYTNFTSPKLSATYLHNLTTILADPGYAQPEPMPYTVTGPATTHDLLLKHSDGRRFLIVWNERIPDGGGTDAVTVDLGQVFPTVNLYDPVLGTGIQSTQTNVQSIPLTMADKPVILELIREVSGAPVINMVSDAVKPGRSINITGDFIDDNASLDVAIELESNGDYQKDPSGIAIHPTIIQRDVQGHFAVATMPANATAGVYNLWVKNATGWSAPYKLNAPRSQFISDYEAFEDIDIEVVGRNFDKAEFGGVTATKVRLNSGFGVTYAMPIKDLNPYHVTLTVGTEPIGNYFIEVSNDNGINWSRPSSNQKLAIIKKTGTTPIGLGVSWEQDFKWNNEVNITAAPYNVNPAKASCTGNDTSAFFNAGLALAQAGGGVIYIPNGQYSIFASALDSGVVWKGQSQAGVQICYLDATNRAMIYSKQADAVGGFPERQGLYNLTLKLAPSLVRPDQFMVLGDNLNDMHMQFRQSCRVFVMNVRIDYDWTTGNAFGVGRGIALVPAGKERFVIRDNFWRGYYAMNTIGYVNQYMTLKNNTYEYKNGGVGMLTKYGFATGNTILVHPPATQPEDESHGLFTRGESYVAGNSITGAGASNSHSRGEGLSWEIIPNTDEGSYNYGTVTSSTKTTMTVAPNVALVTPSQWSGDLSVWITYGRGLGQLRKVASISGGNTIVVAEPFRTAPNSTSKWTLVSPNNNITAYNNTFNDDIVGILPFGASYDTVLANNTFINTDGISYWAINQETNNDVPSYFNRVVRNTSTGIARAAQSNHMGVFTGRITGTFYDTIMFATEFSENSITANAAVNPNLLTVGSMHSGFAIQSPTDPTGGIRDVVATIVESNSCHNMDFCVTLMRDDSGVVVKNNTFDAQVGQFLLNATTPWGLADNVLSTGNVLQ